MSGKITPIRQETQSEEVAERDYKTFCKNDQKKSIIVNGNVKWFSQEKMNKKQNSVVQKKDEYNDAIKKYLQKIDDQRRKLFILHEEDI